jgi:hypothetical protein
LFSQDLFARRLARSLRTLRVRRSGAERLAQHASVDAVWDARDEHEGAVAFVGMWASEEFRSPGMSPKPRLVHWRSSSTA